MLTVKPVFRRHLNIPEKVSLHHRCPFNTCVPSTQVSLHHRCPFNPGGPFITGVPSSHVCLQPMVSLQDRCPFNTGVPVITGVPFITGVPTTQVSLHHRCPLQHRCPFMTGVPSSQVPQHGEDRTLFCEGVPCSEGVLLSECPLFRGSPLIGVSRVQRESSYRSVPCFTNTCT